MTSQSACAHNRLGRVTLDHDGGMSHSEAWRCDSCGESFDLREAAVLRAELAAMLAELDAAREEARTFRAAFLGIEKEQDADIKELGDLHARVAELIDAAIQSARGEAIDDVVALIRRQFMSHGSHISHALLSKLDALKGRSS